MGGGEDAITQTLRACAAGDRSAWERLTPYIYEELRRLAAQYMRHERKGHTLQATALVHESYIRLIGQRLPEFESRGHFFAVASQLMRQVLVDHARAHRSAKRGGGTSHQELDGVEPAMDGIRWDILALDAALRRLADDKPDQAKAVELHYFGGLVVSEIAGVMGRSERSVARDLKAGRLYLLEALGPAS
ncbi:MAG: sigma-70 family RNA polymerase sigma factor [Bryobacterales bacterium]|nr:sigma-70 family RNA polymerase sigma factor [Bryobacterales bacterium]